MLMTVLGLITLSSTNGCSTSRALLEEMEEAPANTRVLLMLYQLLVHEADRLSGFWKLAQVEDVITGAGLVRGACVQTHALSRKSNSSVATSSPTSISIGSTQFS